MQTGRQLTVKINTGAKCNVISRALLQHIDPTAHINCSKRVNLVAYGGHIIQTLGVADMNFSCGLLQFQVVDRNVKPLLGLRESVRLGYVTFGPEVHAVVQQEAPELTEYKYLSINFNYLTPAPSANCLWCIKCAWMTPCTPLYALQDGCHWP